MITPFSRSSPFYPHNSNQNTKLLLDEFYQRLDRISTQKNNPFLEELSNKLKSLISQLSENSLIRDVTPSIRSLACDLIEKNYLNSDQEVMLLAAFFVEFFNFAKRNQLNLSLSASGLFVPDPQRLKILASKLLEGIMNKYQQTQALIPCSQQELLQLIPMLLLIILNAKHASPVRSTQIPLIVSKPTTNTREKVTLVPITWEKSADEHQAIIHFSNQSDLILPFLASDDSDVQIKAEDLDFVITTLNTVLKEHSTPTISFMELTKKIKKNFIDNERFYKKSLVEIHAFFLIFNRFIRLFKNCTISGYQIYQCLPDNNFPIFNRSYWENLIGKIDPKEAPTSDHNGTYRFGWSIAWVMHLVVQGLSFELKTNPDPGFKLPQAWKNLFLKNDIYGKLKEDQRQQFNLLVFWLYICYHELCPALYPPSFSNRAPIGKEYITFHITEKYLLCPENHFDPEKYDKIKRLNQIIKERIIKHNSWESYQKGNYLKYVSQYLEQLFEPIKHYCSKGSSSSDLPQEKPTIPTIDLRANSILFSSTIIHALPLSDPQLTKETTQIEDLTLEESIPPPITPGGAINDFQPTKATALKAGETIRPSPTSNSVPLPIDLTVEESIPLFPPSIPAQNDQPSPMDLTEEETPHPAPNNSHLTKAAAIPIIDLTEESSPPSATPMLTEAPRLPIFRAPATLDKAIYTVPLPASFLNAYPIPYSNSNLTPPPLAEPPLYTDLKQILTTPATLFQNKYCSKLLELMEQIAAQKPNSFNIQSQFQLILDEVLHENSIFTHTELKNTCVLYLRFVDYIQHKNASLIYPPSTLIGTKTRPVIQMIVKEYRKFSTSLENDLLENLISKMLHLMVHAKNKFSTPILENPPEIPSIVAEVQTNDSIDEVNPDNHNSIFSESTDEFFDPLFPELNDLDNSAIEEFVDPDFLDEKILLHEILAEVPLYNDLKKILTNPASPFQNQFFSTLIKAIEEIESNKYQIQYYHIISNLQKILNDTLSEYCIYSSAEIIPISVFFLRFIDYVKQQNINLIYPNKLITGVKTRFVINKVYNDFKQYAPTVQLDSELENLLANIFTLLTMTRKRVTEDLGTMQPQHPSPSTPIEPENAPLSLDHSDHIQLSNKKSKKRKKVSDPENENEKTPPSKKARSVNTHKIRDPITWDRHILEKILYPMTNLYSNFQNRSLLFALKTVSLNNDQFEVLSHFNTPKSKNFNGLLAYDKRCGKTRLFAAHIFHHIVEESTIPILFMTSEKRLKKTRSNLIFYLEQAQSTVAISTLLHWDKIPSKEKSMRGRVIINLIKRLQASPRLKEKKQEKREKNIEVLISLLPQEIKENENLGRLLLFNSSVNPSTDPLISHFDCPFEHFKRLLSFDFNYMVKDLNEDKKSIASLNQRYIFFCSYKKFNLKADDFASQHQRCLAIFDGIETLCSKTKGSQPAVSFFKQMTENKDISVLSSLGSCPEHLSSLFKSLMMVNPHLFSSKHLSDLQAVLAEARQNFSRKEKKSAIAKAFIQMHISASIISHCIFYRQNNKYKSNAWKQFFFSKHLNKELTDFSLPSVKAHFQEFLELLNENSSENSRDFYQEICHYFDQHIRKITKYFNHINPMNNLYEEGTTVEEKTKEPPQREIETG